MNEFLLFTNYWFPNLSDIHIIGVYNLEFQNVQNIESIQLLTGDKNDLIYEINNSNSEKI